MNIETQISKFFTSLGAVILPMVILLTALIIDGAVLLFRSFPGDMNFWVKFAACVLLGFAIAWSLLLTSVNSSLLKRVDLDWVSIGFPEVFGLCTVLMSLFFFDVWNLPAGVHWSKPLLMVFLSVLFGLVEYLYCFIFVAKLKEKAADEATERNYSGLVAAYNEAQVNVDRLQKELLETRKSLHERTVALIEFKKALTCAHCGHVSDSVSKHKRHVSGCEKNPKNREMKGALV